MKKIVALLCFACVTMFFFGCELRKKSKETSGISIVATLFPQYDFAKNIAKDRASIKLLLPPGVDSHTYEPSFNDILNIQESKLFLFTGKDMEPWANRLTKDIDTEKTKILDLSCNIDLIKHKHDDHNHKYDPHFWLDLSYAATMAENIKKALCEIDPEGKNFYEKNANEYVAELKKLDESFKSVVKSCKNPKMVFGGKFAHAYFVKRYGLDYISAYDSCSTESEPSLRKIAEVEKYIKDNGIRCIYYEELSEPKVALSIAKETDLKLLKFSAAHNLSKEDFESGVSFIDIMKENLENLKYGLLY